MRRGSFFCISQDGSKVAYTLPNQHSFETKASHPCLVGRFPWVVKTPLRLRGFNFQLETLQGISTLAQAVTEYVYV